jgi:hypothetical protein
MRVEPVGRMSWRRAGRASSRGRKPRYARWTSTPAASWAAGVTARRASAGERRQARSPVASSRCSRSRGTVAGPPWVLAHLEVLAHRHAAQEPAAVWNEPQPEASDAVCRQPGDVRAIERDAARVGMKNAGDGSQQRRLPGTVAPEERETSPAATVRETACTAGMRRYDIDTFETSSMLTVTAEIRLDDLRIRADLRRCTLGNLPADGSAHSPCSTRS